VLPRNRQKRRDYPRESCGRKNSLSFKEGHNRNEPEGPKDFLPREPEDISRRPGNSPEQSGHGEAAAAAQAGAGRSSFGNEREKDDATAGL